MAGFLGREGSETELNRSRKMRPRLERCTTSSNLSDS